MNYTIYNIKSGKFESQMLQKSNTIKVKADEALVITSKSLFLLQKLEVTSITLETILDRQYTFNYGPYYKTTQYNIFNDAKDGNQKSSNASPITITELTPGVVDIMFYGGMKEFDVKANTIVTICRTKGQAGVTGSADGKEFTAATSMIIFNKNGKISLSSSLYPVVRVSIVKFENLPKFEKVLSFFGPKKLRVKNGAATATLDDVVFPERKILFVVPNPYKMKPEVFKTGDFLNSTCYNRQGELGELSVYPGMCFLEFSKDATSEDYFQIYYDIKSESPYQSNSYYLNGTEGVMSVGDYSSAGVDDNEDFWHKYKNYIFIAVGVIVLIVLIAACCCCCKKKKKDNYYSSESSSDYYSSEV